MPSLVWVRMSLPTGPGGQFDVYRSFVTSVRTAQSCSELLRAAQSGGCVLSCSRGEGCGCRGSRVWEMSSW